MKYLCSRSRTTFFELANFGMMKIENNVKHLRLKHMHNIFYNESPKFIKNHSNVEMPRKVTTLPLRNISTSSGEEI